VELNHEFIRNIPPNEILLKPALLKK
jgi:hypothetical protein